MGRRVWGGVRHGWCLGRHLSIADDGPMTGSTRVEIIGRSDALQHALNVADRFAPTPMPMLLVGATGTGKELFAERIHDLSGRRGRFVPVNCAALPRDMIESLLFGHHRGAFTGAAETTTGFVEAAEGGTLFLDELSSLVADAQVKLLRVLESRQVNRLGETRTRRIDFRVIASAQDDVRTRVEAGLFRFDLYERVAGVVLSLPALRDRGDDVVLLAEYFTALGGRTLESGSLPVLRSYGWPGNVRELRSAIERAGFLSEHDTVGPSALREALALGAPGPPSAVSPLTVDDAERDHLIAVCRDAGWDARRAAAALGISSPTLYRRLRAAGVSLRGLRARRT
jgi:transcriptional regulator with PAS, ATPase and Fis domain